MLQLPRWVRPHRRLTFCVRAAKELTSGDQQRFRDWRKDIVGLLPGCGQCPNVAVSVAGFRVSGGVLHLLVEPKSETFVGALRKASQRLCLDLSGKGISTDDSFPCCSLSEIGWREACMLSRSVVAQRNAIWRPDAV